MQHLTDNINVMYRNRPPEGSMIMLSRSSGVIRLNTQEEAILIHQVTSEIRTTCGSHLANKMETGASSAHVGGGGSY